MNRQKTTHIGSLPPKADKGQCTLFDPKEADEPPPQLTANEYRTAG